MYQTCAAARCLAKGMVHHKHKHLNRAVEQHMLQSRELRPQDVELWADAHPRTNAVYAAWCGQGFAIDEGVTACGASDKKLRE